MAIIRADRPDQHVQTHVCQGVAQGIGSIYMKYPRTAAEMATLTGRTPSHGWNMQDASGGAVALFGGVNWAEGSAPTYRVNTPYAGRRAIGFTSGNADRLQEASAAFHDDGVTSWAWVAHISTGNWNTGGFKYLYSQSAAQHALLRSTNGQPVWQVYDGADVAAITLAVDHSNTDTWLWWSIDRTNNLTRFASRLAAGSADASLVGTLAAAVAEVGSLAATGSLEFDLLALYRFEGSNAEGDPQSTLDALARYVTAA